MAGSLNAIHTYSDPGLDKQKTFDYELSIRLSADAFVYCIFDSNTGKFLHIEAFDLSEPGKKIFMPGDREVSDTSKLVQLLEGELQWLPGNFSRIRLILDQGKSTLVPEALFSESEKARIFDFNVAGGPHEAAELMHDHIKSLHAYAIYHIPASITDLIHKFFPDALIFHHSTALIQSLFIKTMNLENDKMLFVNTGKSGVDILRINAKKLEYFNSFQYNTADDYMYYLIFVVEQLGLNPESVEVMMMGEVDRHSSLSDLVRKYVRNVDFMKRNDDYRYSFVFDQLPGQYYYNLLNASLCE
ncbi:MAG: DUF3822 family protein [Bacteroidota bacterium]